MNPSWDHLGPLAVILGQTLPDLGTFGALLIPSWGQLGLILVLLGRSWELLSRSGSGLGVVWADIGALLGAHGAVLPRLGTAWTPNKYDFS